MEAESKKQDGDGDSEPSRFSWLKIMSQNSGSTVTESETQEVHSTSGLEAGVIGLSITQNTNEGSVNDVQAQIDRPAVRWYVLLLRSLYFIDAVLIAVAAILSVANLKGVFLAVYSLFFSCCLCSLSCPVPRKATRYSLVSNFGFMYRGIVISMSYGLFLHSY